MTAGVLRGDRARFQVGRYPVVTVRAFWMAWCQTDMCHALCTFIILKLFGDTVNTGTRNQVHRASVVLNYSVLPPA